MKEAAREGGPGVAVRLLPLWDVWGRVCVCAVCLASDSFSFLKRNVCILNQALTTAWVESECAGTSYLTAFLFPPNVAAIDMTALRVTALRCL